MSLHEWIRDLNLPEPASTFAPEIDQTITIIYIVSTFFFLLITGLTLYFCFKYRQQKSDSAIPPRITHNTGLEIFWTIVPTIIVFWFFWIGARGYLDMQVPDANAVDIGVRGQKWNWTFTYPEANGRTDRVLWLPEDTPVRLTMRSADVTHSFFIPAFRVKADINANRISEIWFKTTKKTGLPDEEIDGLNGFRVYCAEYCGQDHSRMTTYAYVVDRDTWNKKMDEISKKIVTGEQLFKENCASCHRIDGKSHTGPALNAIWGKQEELEGGRTVTVDDEYFLKSLLNPGADIVKGYSNQMTPFRNFNDQEVQNLMNYIKSLTPSAE